MKKSKFFANLIILLIFASIIFVRGWLQISIKNGSCGVLISKTSGVYDKPIIPGQITWRWERLLPTNSDLRVFQSTPYISKQIISGKLPSAEIYSAQIKEKPDFSYNVELSVSLRFTPEGIVDQVKEKNIKSQNDIEKILQDKASIIAKKVMEFFIENKEKDLSFCTNAISDSELTEIVNKEINTNNEIEVISVEVKKAVVPDMELYRIAKKSFLEYQMAVNDEMKKNTAQQAQIAIEDNRTIERLEKVGQLMQKYPQLQDILKNGDASTIMNTMKALR